MLVIPLLFLVWFYFDLLSFSRYIQFKPSTYSLTKSRLSSFLLSFLPSFLCSFIHEYDRSFSYSFSYILCIHFCIISSTYFNLYPIRNLKVTRTHTVTNGVLDVYSTNHVQIWGVNSKKTPQTGNVTQIQRNKLKMLRKPA